MGMDRRPDEVRSAHVEQLDFEAVHLATRSYK